ncbi:MAG: ABC transporter ATP-binding protein [Deltaproteobacteria bacterium]|nr:ABC transporter ATP-binding protein [Deltaproteobacteria bacterium]
MTARFPTRIAMESKAIGKIFGKITALKDISFKVKSGTIVAVVGHNGSGKTTLLKILTTLITPTSGEALVNGYSILKNPYKVREGISFVSSEDRSFYWRLTGRQNLIYFASLYNLPLKEAKKRADEMLIKVGLDHAGNTRFNEYSTGMKQLLGIARGLIPDTPVLLLDEPTRSLSQDSANRIYTLIKNKTANGGTILMTSHNPVEVEKLADHIIVLDNGIIKHLGAMAQIKSGL